MHAWLRLTQKKLKAKADAEEQPRKKRLTLRKKKAKADAEEKPRRKKPTRSQREGRRRRGRKHGERKG
jgi:hypothetical protein